MSTKRLTALITREEDAYVALCPELDVASQGETVEAARNNLTEAVELFLETADQAEIAARLSGEVFVTSLEVARIRDEVYEWRKAGYEGAADTSKALLRWWFTQEHPLEGDDGATETFRYYFAQREAVETVIWLHDVRKARDKFDLLRFDASGAVSPKMFDEQGPRYVVKMATGAGKTKVLSLLIAWSYFHKLYEPDSTLSRNFLLIAPNIIVLDRLRADFDGLKIFFGDPILSDNGYNGHNWRDDFQITLHIQDEVRAHPPTGNIFLTNIHRVFLGAVREPSLDDPDLRDYFLAPFGRKPSGKTTDSKTDLGEIVREIDELAVFNDEAHHIHDPKMAWFKSMTLKPAPRPPRCWRLSRRSSTRKSRRAYIFENEWQSFRARQSRELELTSAAHAYERPGRYTVAVKVIDIFGNDTMTLVPVNVG